MGDGGRGILVAEADDGLRRDIAAWLEDDGHSVVCAATGLEALELARMHRPALVVLSEDLPWLDGGQVARALRREPELQRTKIVALVERVPGVPGLRKRFDCEATLTRPPPRGALIALVRKFGNQNESMVRLKAAASASGVLGWLSIGGRRQG
jgi:CheY-like chemotaxis protein